jgi:hypothetical protein
MATNGSTPCWCMQLFGIHDQLDNVLDQAARANPSAREPLILLCGPENARRDLRRIEMALKPHTSRPSKTVIDQVTLNRIIPPTATMRARSAQRRSPS